MTKADEDLESPSSERGADESSSTKLDGEEHRSDDGRDEEEDEDGGTDEAEDGDEEPGEDDADADGSLPSKEAEGAGSGDESGGRQSWFSVQGVGWIGLLVAAGLFAARGCTVLLDID